MTNMERVRDMIKFDDRSMTDEATTLIIEQSYAQIYRFNRNLF